jgi:hypothetical protein
VVLGALFAVSASYVPPLAFPIVLVADLLALYLMALVIVPPSQQKGIDRFTGILRQFMELALRSGAAHNPNEAAADCDTNSDGRKG